MKALVVAVLAVLCVPSVALADDADKRLCGEWGIIVWGLSVHLDDRADYNNVNWGAGLRCYARPPWKPLGTDRRNRIFLQADALLNSHRGLLLPLSAGAEYRVGSLTTDCGFLLVGALTVAYYDNARTNRRQVKWGPVPGVGVRCGKKIGANVAFVPATSRQVVAAITASLTITFVAER